MGAANSCTCVESSYRFKDFIVSVYPHSVYGNPDEDALGKLKGYISSNPERIPRVCRKIGKLLSVQVKKKKEDQAMVSVHMLRSIIEDAARVNDFVPHSMDICASLLSTNISRYHIGAADVLSTLCYRLSTQPNTDSARRLVADNRDRLVPQLLKMTSDHIASRRDGKAVQTRYAAILALSNIASCIHTALAGSSTAIMEAMIVNLTLVLQERAQRPLSDASLRLLSMHHYGGSDATSAVSPIVQLPVDMEERDVMYALACSHGIGTTAACTTTAGVVELLSRVTTLLEKKNGWGITYLPSLVFSDIVAAMQRRPQQLGFCVYQCLCEVGQRTSDPNVRIGVLRSLHACVDMLPMTGGRPAVVLNHIMSVMQMPMTASTVKESGTEGARLIKDTHDVIVLLTSRLLRSCYLQSNAPQLQNILISLWHLLEMAQSCGKPHPRLALLLLIVAAPFLRSVPLVDRRDMRVTEGLEYYLNNDNDDAQRRMASRVLTGILAGIPVPKQSAVGGVVGGTESVTAVAAAPSATPPHPIFTEMLFTAEKDVVFAQEWVMRVSNTTEGITPLTVVSVADVLCALMAGYGVRGLPFHLRFLWTLQQRCIRAAPASTATETTPSTQATQQDNTASLSNAAVATTLVSKNSTSPLTRAWLHMIVVSLICCGRVYALPKLEAYGQEILERRSAAGHLASCFEAAVRVAGHAADAYTVSGLRYLASEKNRSLGADFTEAPVSKLPSFSFVSNIIADTDRADIAAAFGAREGDELHTVIDAVCFQPDREVGVCLASATAPCNAQAPITEAAPKQGLPFSLNVQDEAKVNTLRSLRVSVADNSVPRTQDSRGVVLLSAAATTTASKVQEIAEFYKVSAATPVLTPETMAALPPLPTLSPPRYDKETSEGMGEFGETASGVRGKVKPLPVHQVELAADGRSHNGAGTVSAVWINPLNLDVGIQAARKAQTTTSIRALPASVYVSMV
ncbi:hypothetical protein JKF63_06017 [Porcisia hertigi]|uniref:Uncharacterized protein n=1 Tax=Porcisia hertigi TaxID=2761500 RepID=A0A836IBR8_9TRYP|nr:hypothetical protein JKF63_06017 [Porcisia hertigi]